MLSSAVHAAPRRTFAEHLFAPPPHPAPGPVSWAHTACGPEVWRGYTLRFQAKHGVQARKSLLLNFRWVLKPRFRQGNEARLD